MSIDFETWVGYRTKWRDTVREVVLSHDFHKLKALYQEIVACPFEEAVAAYCFLYRYLLDTGVQVHLLDKYVFCHTSGFRANFEGRTYEDEEPLLKHWAREKEEKPELANPIKSEKWDLETTDDFQKYVDEMGRANELEEDKVAEQELSSEEAKKVDKKD